MTPSDDKSILYPPTKLMSPSQEDSLNEAKDKITQIADKGASSLSTMATTLALGSAEAVETDGLSLLGEGAAAIGSFLKSHIRLISEGAAVGLGTWLAEKLFREKKSESLSGSFSSINTSRGFREIANPAAFQNDIRNNVQDVGRSIRALTEPDATNRLNKVDAVQQLINVILGVTGSIFKVDDPSIIEDFSSLMMMQISALRSGMTIEPDTSAQLVMDRLRKMRENSSLQREILNVQSKLIIDVLSSSSIEFVPLDIS